MKYYSKYLHLSIGLFLLLPAATLAQNLKLVGGCRVTNSGPIHIVLHNAGLSNDGIFSEGSSTVWLTGAQPVTISSGNAITFNNLIVDKSTGDMAFLQQDISVKGTLNMKKGNVQLSNRSVNLGSTGSILGENAQSYITDTGSGRITVTRNITTAVNAFNPGNIGVEITSASGMGQVTVERKHKAVKLAGGSESIKRIFTIAAGTTSPIKATLRFYYFDHELNGNQELALAVWNDAALNGTWNRAGKDANDITANWVEKKDIKKLGAFTLAASSNATQITQGSKSESMSEEETVIQRVIGFPNPVLGKFNIAFYLKEEKNFMLGLYDVTGRLLERKIVNGKPGNNGVQWDMAKYPPGFYSIADPQGSIKLKVVKR